jgi:hypothetical protein
MATCGPLGSLADVVVSWELTRGLVVPVHAVIGTLDAGFLHALLLLWRI